MVVDFSCDDGLLYVAVKNISDRPATKVSATFRRQFRGLGGTVVIPSLRVFRNVEFLSPRSEIRALVDTTEGYFSRDEPREITATTTFHDLDGTAFRRTVRHDLGIFEDLPFVVSDRGRH